MAYSRFSSGEWAWVEHFNQRQGGWLVRKENFGSTQYLGIQRLGARGLTCLQAPPCRSERAANSRLQRCRAVEAAGSLM